MRTATTIAALIVTSLAAAAPADDAKRNIVRQALKAHTFNGALAKSSGQRMNYGYWLNAAALAVSSCTNVQGFTVHAGLDRARCRDMDGSHDYTGAPRVSDLLPVRATYQGRAEGRSFRGSGDVRATGAFAANVALDAMFGADSVTFTGTVDNFRAVSSAPGTSHVNSQWHVRLQPNGVADGGAGSGEWGAGGFMVPFSDGHATGAIVADSIKDQNDV